MVKQLMSFGEFLMGELYGEWLDNPEAIKDFGAWLRGRAVTIADLENWSKRNPDLYSPENTEPRKDEPAIDA